MDSGEVYQKADGGLAKADPPLGHVVLQASEERRKTPELLRSRKNGGQRTS